MTHIRRKICAAAATIAIAFAAPATAQQHDQHAPPAASAEPDAPKMCPMMKKSMDHGSPGAAGGEMHKHMTEMHQMMQQMHADMQAMHKEMAQLREEMQRRR